MVTKKSYLFIVFGCLLVCGISIWICTKAYLDNEQIKSLYYGQCFRKPDLFFVQQQWHTFLATMHAMQKKQTVETLRTELHALTKKNPEISAYRKTSKVRYRRRIPVMNYEIYQKMRLQQRECQQEHVSIFQWPIEKKQFWLSSLFGPRKKADGSWGFHTAIDLAAVKGTPVKAALDGTVIEAGYSKKGYGRTIVIRHENSNYQTRYAHLQKIVAKVGQRIKVGQVIGSVGDTGYVRGENGRQNASHLHFEVKLNGRHIDPLTVLV